MSPSPPQPEFFVDRSLGRHAVPHALRADGWLLRTHLEVFGSRDEEVPDTEWLEFCGDEGLIVLTKDQRIRYRPAEIEVAARFAVRMFALANRNLKAQEQSERFIRHRARIEAAARERARSSTRSSSNGYCRVYPPALTERTCAAVARFVAALVG